MGHNTGKEEKKREIENYAPLNSVQGSSWHGVHVHFAQRLAWTR